MDETVDTFSKAICSKWLQAVDGIFALGERAQVWQQEAVTTDRTNESPEFPDSNK